MIASSVVTPLRTPDGAVIGALTQPRPDGTEAISERGRFARYRYEVRRWRGGITSDVVGPDRPAGTGIAALPRYPTVGFY